MKTNRHLIEPRYPVGAEVVLKADTGPGRNEEERRVKIASFELDPTGVKETTFRVTHWGKTLKRSYPEGRFATSPQEQSRHRRRSGKLQH